MNRDGFIRRWFWRCVFAFWTRMLDRFVAHDLRIRGFVRTGHSERTLHQEDEYKLLTALQFALETAAGTSSPC